MSINSLSMTVAHLKLLGCGSSRLEQLTYEEMCKRQQGIEHCNLTGSSLLCVGTHVRLQQAMSASSCIISDVNITSGMEEASVLAVTTSSE